MTMQKTIQAIVHPFFTLQHQYNNIDLYKNIASKVIENPNSFLYYIATLPDVNSYHDPSRGRDHDYRFEIEMQEYLQSLPQNIQARMALFTEKNGENAWHSGHYRTPGISTIMEDLSFRNEYALSWFAKNHARTYYDQTLQKAYTDITGMEGMPFIGLLSNTTERTFRREGKRTFLETPLHPQITKIIKFLGLRPDEMRINGGSTFIIPDETTNKVNIVGSGEYLEACVFAETIGLSILLGVPVQNVSLNIEQPYLRDETKNHLLYKQPVEILYPPTISSERFSPGFRK